MRLMRHLGRAVRLRCPNCGSSGVVHSWAKVAVACPQCGHRFEREEGYWLGAVLINTVAAVGVFAGLFVALTVSTWPDVPWNTVLVVTLLVNLVFPVLFYPWARMLWVAIDLTIRPAEGESG